MKPSLLFRFSTVLALAAGLSAAVADTIKLKNGELLEGTITEETPAAVVIEVKDKGITDWRTVNRSEIAEMNKSTEDEKEALALLAKLKPTADAMSAADYDKVIKGQIQPWLTKYKTSKKRKDVDELLKLYTDEMNKVKAGDLKLRGAWITAEEIKWNEYNVNARKLRVKFEELVKAKKFADAYGVFAEMEVSGPAGVDFPPVLEAAKKLLPSVEASIMQAIEMHPVLTAERKKLLDQQTPDKKREMTAVIKAEADAFRKKSALEKKNKITVPSFYAYDLKTIQTTLDIVKKEAPRLAAIDIPGLTLANKRFEQGLKEMNSKAFLSAKNNFEAAARFHTKDAFVKKMVEEATKAADAAKGKPAAR